MTDSPFRKTERQAALERAEQYYGGSPTPQIRTRSNQPSDFLPLPLPRVIVDKGAAFLFGKDALSQIVDDASGGPQKWLDEAWRRNKRGIFLQKLATNGGIFGHAFVRLLERSPFPRVIVLDPKMVEVETDPTDIDDVWSYTITLPEQEFDDDGDGKVDRTVRKRTLIENQNAHPGYDMDQAPQWVIADQEYRGTQTDGGAWVTLSEQTWSYPFSPVIGCQNLPRANSYWGESDLPQDVLTLIDGINRTTSYFQKIVRLHAFPKVWTRGMGSQKLDLAPDSVTHLPSETAELKALETHADLPSIMGLLEKLLSLNAYAVRIPLIAMGQPDGAGSLSGVSLQIRYQPLVEKTESKRMTYGDLLVEIDRCLLAMGGFGDGTLTQIVWPEMLPKDALQERQVMVLDDQLGIASKETLANRAGYEWSEEQKRIEGEQTAAIAAGLIPDPALANEEKKLVPGADVGQKAAA